MPEPVLRLGPQDSFAGLDFHNKRYAFHLARAAWHGARIVMRQVSAESSDVFDFILELHSNCKGEWFRLAADTGVSEQDLEHFLDYAASFLSNVANYYGQGDQKFVPMVSAEVLPRLASTSPSASKLLTAISDDLYAVPPHNLGFPSATAQSQYYVDSSILSNIEHNILEEAMSRNGILPENVRLHKTHSDKQLHITILQASVEADASPTLIHNGDECKVWLRKGDHSEQLAKVCAELEEAIKYTTDEDQRQSLVLLIQSLRTGDLHTYRESLKKWIAYSKSAIEYVFGFVEPYRDPAGVKAEFEGIVGLLDLRASKTVQVLASSAPQIISRLPWVVQCGDKGGYGPFENASFKPPSFVCMEILAYCSSIIFGGINLPNYNDLREQCGHKSLIITDRMRAPFDGVSKNPFIPESEQELFQAHAFETYQLYVILHELYGHPTGKMLVEGRSEQDKFRAEDLPINPLNGLPVTSWYKNGQAWTSVFSDLSTTVDECRCELVSAFTIDNEEMLSKLGYGQKGRPSCIDVLYNLYQQLGTDGLYGLADYHPEDGSWGSAHSQAHFAMLQWLLRKGEGVVKVEHSNKSLLVKVDRSKVQSHGTPAIADMLLRLHIFRCTADIKSCRQFYNELSTVLDDCLAWYKIVKQALPPKKNFVQPNIVLRDGDLLLKHYPATSQGVIQSWVDRNI